MGIVPEVKQEKTYSQAIVGIDILNRIRLMHSRQTRVYDHA